MDLPGDVSPPLWTPKFKLERSSLAMGPFDVHGSTRNLEETSSFEPRDSLFTVAERLLGLVNTVVYAVDLHIVHRDLSPDNILILDSRPHLIDWDCAGNPDDHDDANKHQIAKDRRTGNLGFMAFMDLSLSDRDYELNDPESQYVHHPLWDIESILILWLYYISESDNVRQAMQSRPGWRYMVEGTYFRSTDVTAIYVRRHRLFQEHAVLWIRYLEKADLKVYANSVRILFDIRGDGFPSMRYYDLTTPGFTRASLNHVLDRTLPTIAAQVRAAFAQVAEAGKSVADSAAVVSERSRTREASGMKENH